MRIINVHVISRFIVNIKTFNPTLYTISLMSITT